MLSRKPKKTKKILRWNIKAVGAFVNCSLKSLAKKKRSVGPRSPWWVFIWDWPKKFPKHLSDFMSGTYHFEPLQTYSFKDETVTMWSYGDRLFVRALLFLIKATFKNIISSRCFHLKGPAGVGMALNSVIKALTKGGFHYFMRIDISGYYASIDRSILVKLSKKYFDDPIVLNYLEQIITIPIIQNGAILNPECGIHRRSSLSPFFGALYLDSLDKAFEQQRGVFYARYMDDLIVLFKNKRQFLKAKHRLQKILSQLKLRCARSKTKMGPLTRGFHFLGIEFQLNIQRPPKKEAESVKEPVPQSQALQNHLLILLHERCCQRAHLKVALMGEDSAPPGKAQRYLCAWARWWSRIAPPISSTDCITRWIDRTQRKQPEIAWLGSGVLYYPSRPQPLPGRVLPIAA